MPLLLRDSSLGSRHFVVSLCLLEERVSCSDRLQWFDFCSGRPVVNVFARRRGRKPLG